jgi:DNA phosphorothioation-dependent restriction protein DptG
MSSFNARLLPLSPVFGIHLSILSRSSIAFFIDLNKFILLFEFIYVAVLIS